MDSWDKTFESPSNVDVDSDFTWFYSQMPVKEVTSNRFDGNQHVAGAHASVIRTSLCSEEN